MTDYDELDAAVAPLRATHPGITNAELAPMLPVHLRSLLWSRAIHKYFAAAEVARLDAERGSDS